MKRILVPIDFSNKATCAAKVASKIALRTNAELYLLHIINVPVDVVDPISYNELKNTTGKMLYIKKAQERFQEFKKSPFFENIIVKDFVQYYKSSNGIIEESKKHQIDLIVMGSTGTSGIEEILVGSNTERVVRNSDIPVMVVKNDIENFEIKNIVFASDFNPKIKRTFQRILDFTTIFDANLHLLRVNTIQNFETSKKSEETIANFTKDYQINRYETEIYNDVTIESGVLNYARKVDADIIAINTHGRRGLAHLFNGSISEDLSNHAKRPVITFKIQR